jgi:hypothetical protein
MHSSEEIVLTSLQISNGTVHSLELNLFKPPPFSQQNESGTTTRNRTRHDAFS